MKDLQQKFKVHIDLDLNEEGFDVSVINMNTRKGFVDIEALTEKLREVMVFLQHEGMHDLIEQITKEQMQ